MASLTHVKARSASGKHGWRIQFVDGVGVRRSIYMGPVPKKMAESWVSRVERIHSCNVTGSALDTELAVWIRDLPDVAHEKLARAGLVESRVPAEASMRTLRQLADAFLERSSGKQATIRGFKQTLDCLIEFFGADTAVQTITAEDADKWRAWVVTDRMGSGER